MASDPYRYFRIEARELVDGLGQGVVELERGAVDPSTLANLLRLAHTLKGAARVVKKIEIADRAHRMEEIFGALRESGRGIEKDEVGLLFEAIQSIESDIQALSIQNQGLAVQKEPGHVAQTTSTAALDDVFQTVRVDVPEMDELLRSLSSVGAQQSQVKRHLVELRRLVGQHTAQPNHDGVHGGGGANAGYPSDAGLARDLVHGLARVLRGFEDSVQRLEQELDEARLGAERLRLIPVRSLFSSLSRAVSDAARTLDKKVRFEMPEVDLRLDAQVLGPLRDAFLHVVRNAVAHGIEPVSERTSKGKPAEGCVRLDVVRRAGQVEWRCEDDGRGIDMMAVRRALERRGTVESVHSLTHEQLLERLLSGGISTSPEVTQISGRGIGLDVVREAAQRLKGSVKIESDPSWGTRIVVRVPVSLLSLRALLVVAGETTAAIPLSSVRQVVRLEGSEISDSSGSLTVSRDGEALSFAPLARLLRSRNAVPTDTSTAVIVVSGDRSVALGVDRLLGTSDIVVRPLPPGIFADPVVSAVSLDAEGEPRLVLDSAQVVELAAQGWSAEPAAAVERPPILVIDDSLTTRMLEQSILESAGYDVELAVSAEEGLEKARLKAYAMFLVDVEMPGMNGFEFVSQTRADPDLRHIPAILVTSRSDERDLKRGKAVGASDYIVKGEFDQKRLLSSIERLLS